MGPIDAMIVRLAGVVEGSRELDEAIFELVVGRPIEHADLGNGLPLPYTRSLDAAMGLVPAGWRTDVGYEFMDSSRWVWGLRRKEGRVGRFDSPGSGATAATAPLALCAAALRARLVR